MIVVLQRTRLIGQGCKICTPPKGQMVELAEEARKDDPGTEFRARNAPGSGGGTECLMSLATPETPRTAQSEGF